MTGRGRGFCVVKLPSGAQEPVRGVAGLAKRPGRLPDEGPEGELARLRGEIQQLEIVLQDLRRRIGELEKKTVQTAGGDLA